MSNANFQARLQRIQTHSNDLHESAQSLQASKPKSAEPSPKRPQASGLARAISSVIGFLFGLIACSYMFLAAGVRDFGTDNALLMAGDSVIIACALTLLTITLGIIGLFARRFGLVRAPIYFVLAATLT